MSRNPLNVDRVGGGAEHVCDVVEVGGGRLLRASQNVWLLVKMAMDL